MSYVHIFTCIASVCVYVWKFSLFHLLLSVTERADWDFTRHRGGNKLGSQGISSLLQTLCCWAGSSTGLARLQQLFCLLEPPPTYWAPEWDTIHFFLNLALHLFLPFWFLPDKTSVVTNTWQPAGLACGFPTSPSHLDPRPGRKYVFLLLLKSPSSKSSLLSALITLKLFTAVVQGRSLLCTSTHLLYSYGKGRKETHLFLEGHDSEVGRHRVFSFQLLSVFWSSFL